jgi:hypothetical protein
LYEKDTFSSFLRENGGCGNRTSPPPSVRFPIDTNTNSLEWHGVTFSNYFAKQHLETRVYSFQNTMFSANVPWRVYFPMWVGSVYLALGKKNIIGAQAFCLQLT